MPFWYNVATEGSKFNSLACSDWTQINSVVQFDEMGIKFDDEFYHLFGWATSATDVIKMGDKDFKVVPQYLSLKIARKNYQKYDMKQKKKVDCDQSLIEALICKLLEKHELDKIYKANIQLQNSNIVKMLLTGIDTMGNPMPEGIQDSMSAGYLSMVEVVSPQQLKIDDFAIPSKSGGNYGSKSQSEAERIADRMKFVIDQLKLAAPSLEISNCHEIVAAIENNKDIPAVWDVISTVIK